MLLRTVLPSARTNPLGALNLLRGLDFSYSIEFATLGIFRCITLDLLAEILFFNLKRHIVHKQHYIFRSRLHAPDHLLPNILSNGLIE